MSGFQTINKPTHSYAWVMHFREEVKKAKGAEERKEGLCHLLHVLYGTGQESLLAHIGKADHASSAQAVVVL